MEKVKVWPVEKYARFVSGGTENRVNAAVDAANSTAKKTEGVWQVNKYRQWSTVYIGDDL